MQLIFFLVRSPVLYTNSSLRGKFRGMESDFFPFKPILPGRREPLFDLIIINAGWEKIIMENIGKEKKCVPSVIP